MAQSTVIKTLRDGTITFSDGTAITPLTLTVAFETGDLSIDIPGPEVIEFLDRNRHASTPSLRFGKDGVMTGSFTFNLRDWTDAGNPLVEQFLTAGFPTGWVSTMGSTGEVKTCDILWTVEASDHGDVDMSLKLNYCHVTASMKEGDPTVISISFTSYSNYPGTVV